MLLCQIVREMFCNYMYSKITHSIAPHFNNSAISCHGAIVLALDKYAFLEMTFGHHVTRTNDSLSILPEQFPRK